MPVAGTPRDAAGESLDRALDIVAVDMTGEIRVVLSVAEQLDVDTTSLDQLETLGLITISAHRVAFVDPDDARRRCGSMRPSLRRQLHRAFAVVLGEPRHRVVRAEHLAAAAIGPDPQAEHALSLLANEATLDGQSQRAGRLFLRASAFAADAETRSALLLCAGDGFWNAGEYVEARSAFDTAFVGSADPILRADIALQIGQLDMYQRGPQFSCDVFVDAAAAVEPFDIDRAAMLLVHAASTVTVSCDVGPALVNSRRACDLAASGSGTSSMPASLMLAFVSLQHGDTDEFAQLFPSLIQVADALRETDLPDVDLVLQLVGMLHVYTERWPAGRAYLTAVAHRAGRRSRTATAALDSATLAELCWRSGRWDEAWSLARSDLVTEVTLRGARVWLLAFTAHLDAGFGRPDCVSRARSALAESEAMGMGTGIVWSLHALGLYELGNGNASSAAQHLDRLDAIATAQEMIDPSTIWWQADHVEALIRCDRSHDAERALARFEHSAGRSPALWGRATAARCRAMLDGDAHWFDVALEHHARLDAPFELGRTLLCRAEQCAAGRSNCDPKRDLDEAHAIFDALGATAWSAQVVRLRRQCGAEVTDVEQLLSPAEWKVASAVADGLGNRDIATDLFVSIKTVEFHLRNIYRKLGVRSRTQLALAIRSR